MHRKSPLGIHYAQKKLMPNHKHACQIDLFCPFIFSSYISYLSLIVKGPGHCLRNGEGSRVGKDAKCNSSSTAVLPSVINAELEEEKNFVFVYLSLHLTGLPVLWNGLGIGLENLCSPADVLSRVRKKTKQLQQ